MCVIVFVGHSVMQISYVLSLREKNMLFVPPQKRRNGHNAGIEANKWCYYHAFLSTVFDGILEEIPPWMAFSLKQNRKFFLFSPWQYFFFRNYIPVPWSFASGKRCRPLLRRCNLKTRASCSSVGMSAISTPSQITNPYSAAARKTNVLKNDPVARARTQEQKSPSFAFTLRLK